MLLFEWTLVLLVAAVILTAIARRLHVPRGTASTVVARWWTAAATFRDSTIGDDAFHRVEEELDRAELYADSDVLTPDQRTGVSR
jgi:hypothetical protein